MRYREGTNPELLENPATDGLTIFTAIFSLITGIGFVVVGLRARQRWMVWWGAGLAITSAAYLGAVILGYA